LFAGVQAKQCGRGLCADQITFQDKVIDSGATETLVIAVDYSLPTPITEYQYHVSDTDRLTYGKAVKSCD